MSKNSNSRTAPPRKGGSSLLAAVLVGMVLGLILAGGVAWYILQRPNPFVNNAPHETVKLTPDPVKPPPAPVANCCDPGQTLPENVSNFDESDTRGIAPSVREGNADCALFSKRCTTLFLALSMRLSVAYRLSRSPYPEPCRASLG